MHEQHCGGCAITREDEREGREEVLDDDGVGLAVPRGVAHVVAAAVLGRVRTAAHEQLAQILVASAMPRKHGNYNSARRRSHRARMHNQVTDSESRDCLTSPKNQTAQPQTRPTTDASRMERHSSVNRSASRRAPLQHETSRRRQLNQQATDTGAGLEQHFCKIPAPT